MQVWDDVIAEVMERRNECTVTLQRVFKVKTRNTLKRR
jgi:hypothetical protein